MTDLTNDELRARVAELMGCRRYKRPFDGKVFLCLANPALWAPWSVVNEPIDRVNSDVPDYPNDHNAALQLCNRMHEEGLTVTIEKSAYDDDWRVWIRGTNDSQYVFQSDPSLPRAICLAFIAKEEGETHLDSTRR